MSFDESSGNRDNNEGKSPSVHMGSLVDKKPQLKSQAEFWGQEYKGLKGIETVDKLLQTKQGHVKAAFNRPEIGDIDLVWGDSRGGLRHLTERRDEDYNRGKSRVNGKQMASLIPYILDRGDFGFDDKHNRGYVEHEGYRVAINPSYLDKKIVWIVTAFEQNI